MLHLEKNSSHLTHKEILELLKWERATYQNLLVNEIFVWRQIMAQY